MTNEPTSRTERRQQERELQKDFETVAREIRRKLDERQDDEFKLALIQALQHLEVYHHDNNRIAALLIDGCLECVGRNDEPAARLLLYLSGVIVNSELTKNTLNIILLARQRPVLPQGPQPPQMSAQ